LWTDITKKKCTYKIPHSNQVVDLSKLANSKQDYFIPKNSVPKQTWDVWINVCREIVGAPGKPQPCGSGISGCQQWDPNSQNGKASMGTVSSAVFQPLTIQGKQGVTVQYTGGTGQRKMEIDFVCNPQAGDGKPVFTAENPSLHYNFMWESKYACPKTALPGGLTGGGIFLILFFVGAAVYLVGGILWQKFKVGASGLELIPNLTFWTSLPGLIKDGVMFMVNSTCRRGAGTGSYSQVK